jgi:hypothetical protein
VKKGLSVQSAPTRLPKKERELLEAKIKKVLEICCGHVGEASELLGIPYNRLSRMLNTGDLYIWWRRYKEKRIAANARARQQRAYRRQKMRALIESGYDEETARAIVER